MLACAAEKGEKNPEKSGNPKREGGVRVFWLLVAGRKKKARSQE